MTENPLTAQELEKLFGKVDWEKVFKDELIAEIQKQYDHHLMTTLYGSSFADSVMMHPEVYKNMKYNRPMNFLEKLHAGWYWCGEIFSEWCYTMMNDDGEFFNYIQSDYCKYEEDMYYE